MAKSEDSKLVCGACNHANEIERVYCHNCGEKLDRSLLPKIEATKKDDSKNVQRQVKKMMNPNKGSFLRSVKTFILIVAFSAIVAAVFLACLPPESVPPMKSAAMPEKGFSDLWDEMVSRGIQTTYAFTESDINLHLKRTIKSSEGPYGLKFERAFVTLTPGLVTLTAQRDAWGLTLYSSTSFRPVRTNGNWSAEIVGLRFGRLGIDPTVAKIASSSLGYTLGGIEKAFTQQAKQIDRMDRIEPGPGTITFATKPAQ